MNLLLIIALCNRLKNVLILGCSKGEIARYVRCGARRVVGIDISKNVVIMMGKSLEAERINNSANAILMSAEELAFKDSSFDIVCGSGIIHHLDIKKGIREAARVLRKNGIAIFREPLGRHPLVNWYRTQTPDDRSKYEHPLLPKDFVFFRTVFEKVEIKSAGLTSITALLWVKYVKNNFVYKTNKLIANGLDRLLIYIFPFLKYWCWACIIKLQKGDK